MKEEVLLRYFNKKLYCCAFNEVSVGTHIFDMIVAVFVCTLLII